MGTKAWMAGAVGLAMVAGWPMGAGVWRAGPALAAAQEARGTDQQTETEDDETLQEMMVLSIDRDSARSYAALMGLDDLQREMALDMHRDYLEQYRDAAMTTRDVMEQAEDAAGGDPDEMMERVRDRMRVVLAFLDRSVELGEQYVADLGALAIDDTQNEGHRRVVRARQRELAVALVSVDGGERAVDLVRIARGLEPPLRPTDQGSSAADVLLAYERELEPLCGPFATKTFDRYRSMVRSFMEGEADGDTENEMQAAIVSMAETLNAAGDRYARRILKVLPAERQAEWDRSYKLARWPEVYAPSEVHRTHDAAVELEGLTDDQLETIAATMAHYTREAEGANQRWIGAVRDLDEARRDLGRDSTPDDWEAYQARNQAVQAAREARMAIDERFAGRILQILTPEQREAMPAGAGGEIDVDTVLREMGGGG